LEYIDELVVDLQVVREIILKNKKKMIEIEDISI